MFEAAREYLSPFEGTHARPSPHGKPWTEHTQMLEKITQFLTCHSTAVSLCIQCAVGATANMATNKNLLVGSKSGYLSGNGRF